MAKVKRFVAALVVISVQHDDDQSDSAADKANISALDGSIDRYIDEIESAMNGEGIDTLNHAIFTTGGQLSKDRGTGTGSKARDAALMAFRNIDSRFAKFLAKEGK